jgi:hypothetical protein
VRDLVVNLLASVLAGAAVWATQRLLRYRGLARRRAFFGLDRGGDCLLAVPRHVSSPHQLSVHRRDVAALVELATIAKDCGARADLVPEDDLPHGVGRSTEFCVGGPVANPRAAAHLRSLPPGVHMRPPGGGVADDLLTVGTETFQAEPGRAEYAVLARVRGPAGGRPVFVLAGQTSVTNLAAARFLAARHRQLHRRYRSTAPFCLVLRVVEPAVYGADVTDVAADVTAGALQVTAGAGPPAHRRSATGHPVAGRSATGPDPAGQPDRVT